MTVQVEIEGNTESRNSLQEVATQVEAWTRAFVVTDALDTSLKIRR
jgi:hypothetical protein